MNLAPNAVTIAAAGLVSIAGMGLVLRALHRRHRALRPTWESLDDGSVSAVSVAGASGLTALTAGLALGVPVVTTALVMAGRAELRDCFARVVRGEPPECSHWTLAAAELQSDLAWGAMTWTIVIPVAAIALGLATSLRWRFGYLRSLQAIARGAVPGPGRYRTSEQAQNQAILQRALTRRPPATSTALALWGSVGLAAMAFSSGVVRAVTDMLERLNRTSPPGVAPTPVDLERGLAESASTLDAHLALAAVAIGVALALLIITRRSAIATVVPAPSWFRTLSPATLAMACVALAHPLARENAHPVIVPSPPEAWAERSIGPFSFPLPQLVGDTAIVEAPELRLGAEATMDGQLVADVGAFEDLMRRKRELWSSFHPHLPFPGMFRVAADRRRSAALLGRWLHAARRAGFDTAIVMVSQTIPIDPPALGVWPAWRRLSGVTIALRCGDDSESIDAGVPNVEALAHLARRAPGGAPLCLSTED